MAVQQGSCHVVISILGSLFENNLLNTPPDFRHKKGYSVDLAQYIVKGSELLHVNEQVAKEYPRVLG